MRVLPVVLDGGRGQGQKSALPEMQKQGGQGETKADTESGAKETKGGESVRHKRKHKLMVLEWDVPYKGGRWRNVLKAWKVIKK